MLCALSMDYEGSERWYDELRKYAERCGRQDAAGKRARSRLVWLDISLPQRNVEGLPETLSSSFRLMCSREISLPPFSVTSTMPSVMNGAKISPSGASRMTCCVRPLECRWRPLWGGTGLA